MQQRSITPSRRLDLGTSTSFSNQQVGIDTASDRALLHRTAKLSARMGIELVTETADGAQVARLGRFALDVAAQADDEIVDGTCVGVFVEIPDVLQYRFAGDGMAAVLDQVAKKLGLHQGELEDLFAGSKLEPLEVN